MQDQYQAATERLGVMLKTPERFKAGRDILRANLMLGLASEANTTLAHITRAHQERSLSYLAWSTRGLYELAL